MTKNNDSAATIGFEDQLWRAADALRSNMDAAEYKHVVLGRVYDPCCGSGGISRVQPPAVGRLGEGTQPCWLEYVEARYGYDA